MLSKLQREKDARDRCLPVPHSAKTSPTAHNDYLLQFHPFEQKSKYLDTTTPDDYLETTVPKQWDMGWWEYQVIGYQPPPHPNAPHRQEFSLLGLVHREEKMAVITTKIDLEKNTRMLYLPTTGDPDEIFYDEEHFRWGTVLERNFLPKEQALQIALHYLRQYQWTETVFDKRNETIPIRWEERPFTMWVWKKSRLYKTMDT